MREATLISTILLLVLIIMNFQMPGSDPNELMSQQKYSDTSLHNKFPDPLAQELMALRRKSELTLAYNASRIETLNLKYTDDCKNLLAYYQNIISGMECKNLELKTALEQYDCTQQDWYLFKKNYEFELDSFEQGIKSLVRYNQ